jgi:cell division protein FtsB
MSQSAAVRVGRPVARPATRSAARPAGRPAARLKAVSAPAHTRSRAGLVIGCLALLAVGLIGLLLLNVSLENGAFVRRHQQAQIEQLMEQRQQLKEQIADLEAPQTLAAKAASLGMVDAPSAAFLRASDGHVLGVPSPAVAKVSPKNSADGSTTTTPAKAAAGGSVAATTTPAATGGSTGIGSKPAAGAPAVKGAKATKHITAKPTKPTTTSPPTTASR